MANDDTNDLSRIKEYEQFLLRIPGIFSVKIVVDSNEMQEVHILSDTTRSAKQISRDIQSVFLAHFGFQIPHQIISIARVEMGESVSDAMPVRLLFDSLVVHTGVQAECTVTLLRDQEPFSGTACDANVPSLRPRLVSSATIKAVREALHSTSMFALLDVQATVIAGKKAYCVMITNSTSHGEELLVGCALVRDNEDETVIRATLDALNRKMSICEAV